MKLLLSIFFAFVTYIAISQQLVLPGDYPDPSVAKIGNSFWASATTSNWAPAYPLLESTDLVNWKTRGYVFEQLPAWADYYFWAPEISHENGKTYVYYSAHKRGGNLCVSIASADKPEGPYTDHGPLICQEVGSIDAFPMRDENGKLYLIWKEDGNSVKKPTPIWAQELSEDRKNLIGEKKELFRNDQEWEGNLVEGVAMIRQNGYYYAFYAGAGCCGRGCTYNTGVARSKNLLGPWEKYDKNPLVPVKSDWKCPGHGTPIEKDGKFYFLYHAYHKTSNVYAGRQGLLSEFQFTADGWIEFVNEAKIKSVGVPNIRDEFEGDSVSASWQWSVFKKPAFKITNGQIELDALPQKSGAYIGQKTYTENYVADAMLDVKKSNAESGIALVGDDQNLIALSYKENMLKVWKVEADKETILAEKHVSLRENLVLRVEFVGAEKVNFSYSIDGKKFSKINPKPVEGFFLPPWDRAVRVALISKGEPNHKSVFAYFQYSDR
jgi:xylan 1,4-beta-xylosidase